MLHHDFFGIPYVSETRQSETDGRVYDVFEVYLEGIGSDIFIPSYLANTVREGSD